VEDALLVVFSEEAARQTKRTDSRTSEYATRTEGYWLSIVAKGAAVRLPAGGATPGHVSGIGCQDRGVWYWPMRTGPESARGIPRLNDRRSRASRWRVSCAIGPCR
jgi:hypothetical protein